MAWLIPLSRTISKGFFIEIVVGVCWSISYTLAYVLFHFCSSTCLVALARTVGR